MALPSATPFDRRLSISANSLTTFDQLIFQQSIWEAAQEISGLMACINPLMIYGNPISPSMYGIHLLNLLTNACKVSTRPCLRRHTLLYVSLGITLSSNSSRKDCSTSFHKVQFVCSNHWLALGPMSMLDQRSFSDHTISLLLFLNSLKKFLAFLSLPLKGTILEIMMWSPFNISLSKCSTTPLILLEKDPCIGLLWDSCLPVPKCVLDHSQGPAGRGCHSIGSKWAFIHSQKEDPLRNLLVYSPGSQGNKMYLPILGVLQQYLELLVLGLGLLHLSLGRLLLRLGLLLRRRGLWLLRIKLLRCT
ncbi:hypothetical protein DSO57_1019390 [Entomophthora muscae]|uniref:Uncharacterized protein n=1 Tax=Entomophthora muscae TaxID=34485 RepID=A0ACC2TFB8_9FUNG|nr:hypothetical protein DSO57_1019390 [Entomophthora muscae]